MMARELVIRIDLRAATLILICILAIFLAYTLVRPPKLKTYILADDTCPECMRGLEQTIETLSQQGVDLGTIVEINVWREGRALMKEVNARLAPLVLFEGNIDPQLIPSTIRVGKYYVLRPVWTTRAFDPEKKRIDVYIHTQDVFAGFLRSYIMRTIPNAVVHILPPEREYVVLIEVPKKDANIIRAVIQTDSEIFTQDRVLLGSKRVKEAVIDLFITSLGGNSKKLINMLSRLKQMLGEHIRLVPHYRFVGSQEGYAGAYCLTKDLCSPRGPQEVLENLLETCVYITHGEANWLSFAQMAQHCEGNVQCSMAIAWEMSMDANTLDNCIRGAGVSQAQRDVALSRALGISIVPTVFIGGWFPIVGLQEENVYVQVICSMLEPGICQT